MGCHLAIIVNRANIRVVGCLGATESLISCWSEPDDEKGSAMGADAEVYLFDTKVYDEQVVPFFRKLIQYGSVDAAVDERMVRIQPHIESIKAFVDQEKTQLKATDLDAYCTYLERDFRLQPEHRHLADANAGEWANRDKRACRRWDCPAKAICPFHILDGGNRQIETLATLFNATVKATCLGKSQFVGRSVNVFFFREVLKKNGVSLDSELWKLLFSLGTRGFVIGYEFSNSDGIHGWLMPDETEQLVSLLDPLCLPPVKPTFAAMKRTRRILGGYRVRGWEFNELSLCFVKIVAAIATNEGKGILWGNDVSSWLI
jgi:hypothetical protein